MENELKKRAKFRRKRQRGLPALSTLNPNAGNVEYNVAMFNHMNTPAGGFTNNPISGPMGGDVSAPAASGGMGEALATKIEESAMTREQMISELQKAGKRFYFPKYTDGQIYNMYMKYVVNAPKVVDDTVAVEQEPEVFEEKPTFPDCGTRLTDGGYCPKCDDGEEDMGDLLENKLAANEYQLIYHENSAGRDRRPETIDDLEDDWHVVAFRADSDLDACKEVFERVYDSSYDDYFDETATVEDLVNYFSEKDWSDGSPILIRLTSADDVLYDSGYTKEAWSQEFIYEDLTESRHDPYWTPYGYRAAAKVITGSAPEYYYHLKEIEMDTGDGVKLAKYAVKKGLPVMVDVKSDPDYPEFYLKDGSNEYHWNDYFYPYGTAHLTSKDYVPYTGQDLNTLYNDAEAAKVATYDDDFDMSTRSLL